MALQDAALVAAGAALGALLRFGVSTWLPTKGFPWATLLVNLAGALLVGAAMLPGPSGTRPASGSWWGSWAPWPP